MDFKVQVISDAHIERINPENYNRFNKKEELWFQYIDIHSEIVVLCGDIGNPLSESYWSFVGYVASKCKFVLLIAGNHEYWGHDKEKIDEIIRTRSKTYKNVRFLQRNYFILDNVVFLGCTLWSYIPPQFKKELENWAGDFKSINNCKTIETFNYWHYQDLEWLTTSISNFRKEGFKIVVLTHYTPSFELNFNTKFPITPAMFAFSSDLSFLFPHVSVWVYGHTHFDKSDKHVYYLDNYKTMFVSNQRGYPGNTKSRYSRTFNFCLDKIPEIPIADTNFKNPYDETYVSRVEKQIEKWKRDNSMIR